MWPRLSIVTGLVAGLVVGIAVAVGILAGILAFAPETPGPSIAPPSFALAPADSAPGGSAATPVPAPSWAESASASAAASAAASTARSDRPALFHVGESAPALVVPQVGGGTIDLAALRGKPVWINFMATWCPSCQDELPLMNGFAARYADKGLVVIAIDVREEEGAVATFARRLNVSFPMGLDADGRVSTRWGAIALPIHFWIDAEGIVRDGALGGIGPDVMAAGLRTIMPGIDVRP